MIKILTDSTVQLSQAEVEEYGITIIPLTAMLQSTLYYDNETISKAEFLQKMKESPTLPKSSQPAVGKYIELYDELGKDGSEVLSIHVAGYLSGTYSAAVQASHLTKTTVTVMDSGTLDRAMSYQVLKAAKMAQKGFPIEEILTTLEDLKNKVPFYVGIVDLENLIKGGRIGKTLGRITSALNIKLLLQVTKDSLEAIAKGRGLKSLQKEMQSIIKEMKKQNRITQIGVTHVGLTEFTKDLIAELKKEFPEAIFHIAYASPTLMTHAGNGAFALTYLNEEL